MSVTINGSGTIGGLSAGGLPDGTIQQADLATNVAGNGPAFFVALSANQTIATGTYTKVTFNVEGFDTNSNFDNATNYRFTPTVAGYYQINASLAITNGGVVSTLMTTIYKNGSQFKTNWQIGSSISATYISELSTLIYLNGTTDYLEVYCYQNTGASQTVAADSGYTYFQGVLVRAD